MSNYHQVANSFNLDGAVKAMLSGSVEQLNACYECCDRHADADSEKIALYWQGKDGRKQQIGRAHV